MDHRRDLRCASRGELLGTALLKLQPIGDPHTFLPDNEGTLGATRTLVKEGFVVLPYCGDDPVLCQKLQDLGCAAVMPLAAPIGSGLGMQHGVRDGYRDGRPRSPEADRL